jgi:hypothetical protein
MLKYVAGLAFGLSLMTSPALAEDAKGTAAKPADAAAAATTATVKRVKMRVLMAAGYEIKAVSFVPQDASSRVSKTLDKDAALITLQKGGAAATCFITLEEYVSPGMTDIEWCIEQK